MTTNNSELPTGGRSVRVSGAEHPGWPQLTIWTSHHPWRTVSIGLAPFSFFAVFFVEGVLLAEVRLQNGVDGER